MAGNANYFDLADTAGEIILDVFGDRDAAGELEPVYYQSPQSDRWHSFDAVVSRIEFIDSLDAHGNLSRIETRTVSIRRSDIDAISVATFERRATVKVGDSYWGLREEQTKWGDVFVTLGLVRKPLVEQGGRAAV